jgi:hypothetical protein
MNFKAISFAAVVGALLFASPHQPAQALSPINPSPVAAEKK